MKPAQARVVLTGATGGIGRAAARALLSAGAALMLVGRSPARLAALTRELDPLAGGVPAPRITWQALDLNDAQAPVELAEAAARWQANVLVNNAGVPSFGALASLGAAHFEQVLRTNLLAPMLLTHALLPSLLRQPQAQVIQVGSVLGALALPGYSVYSASKFGLRGFAQALRRELAGSTVTVQYLGPRSTHTDFNDERVLAYNRATRTQMDPPERVAQALVEMLRGEAAERFIGFPEALAVRVNGLAPQLLDGAFATHRRQVASLRAGVPPAPQHDLSKAP
jgi:short-subunit dehydrogenase